MPTCFTMPAERVKNGNKACSLLGWPTTATGRETNGGDLLFEPRRHPCPRLGQVWNTLGKHFAWAVMVPAKELAHRERKLKLASNTRGIFQRAMVITMEDVVVCLNSVRFSWLKSFQRWVMHQLEKVSDRKISEAVVTHNGSCPDLGHTAYLLISALET